MKAVDLLNELQNICHNGYSLKDIKVIMNDKEIGPCGIGLYVENDEVKLVIETE